jgi:hypothetical protein
VGSLLGTRPHLSTQHSYTGSGNLVYRFDKKITPFFSGWDITEINYQQVSELLNQISEDDLTSSTVSAYVRLVCNCCNTQPDRG